MIALGLLAVLAPPVLALVSLVLLMDRVQRRRDEVVARQIEVTDAIHRELGAIVAPTVRRTRGSWRVVLPMDARHPAAARVIELAARAFPAGAPVEVTLVA
jgi:hypothetical protein